MKYLDRALINGPHMALCRSEKEYLREIKRLKISGTVPVWLPPEAAACVIPFTKTSKDGAESLICMVCVGNLKGYSIPQIASILTHEAVHVWQHQEEQMSERNSSREFEAYCIQSIAQKLMEAYWDKKPYRYLTKPT